MSPITYRDRTTPVHLGDHVTLRALFRRRPGRVVYIPGLSTRNPNMERDGLAWVGIRLDEGGFASVLIHPEGRFLVNRIHLVTRDSEGVESIGAVTDPHDVT